MFRKIRQFITSNPSLLSTQLSKLEGNIEAETDDVRASFMPNAADIVRISATQPGQKPYAPGQLVIADNTNNSLTILIAPPDRTIVGKPLLIAVRATSANIVKIAIAPPAPNGRQGLINGAAGVTSVNIAAQGLYVFVCDGQDWWRT